jgi:hypothetical protein
MWMRRRARWTQPTRCAWAAALRRGTVWPCWSERTGAAASPPGGARNALGLKSASDEREPELEIASSVVVYEPKEPNVLADQGVAGMPRDGEGMGDADDMGRREALRSRSRYGRLCGRAARIALWCSFPNAGSGGRGEVGDEARAREARAREARAREAGGEGGASGRSPLSAPWLLYENF